MMNPMLSEPARESNMSMMRETMRVTRKEQPEVAHLPCRSDSTNCLSRSISQAEIPSISDRKNYRSQTQSLLST